MSDEAGEVLTATSADGSEVWSKSLTEPKGFRDAVLQVDRLRDQIAVSWTDVEPPLTLDEDVNPGQLMLLDPATGERQGGTVEIPDAFDFRGVVGYSDSVDSFDMFEILTNEGDEQEFTLMADGSVERVEDENVEPLPEDEFIAQVTPDRQIREVRGQNNARSIELIDTVSSEPVVPATECPSSPNSGARSELSPSSTFVGITQGVVNIETGEVTCMDALSEPPDAYAQVVADDGSAFGAGSGTDGQALTFYLDPAGEVSVEEGSPTLPAALLSGIAVFTAEEGEIVPTTVLGDLVVAYER